MNYKGLFKNKPVGFYITLGTIALTLIMAIVYLLSYNGTDEFSIWAFIVLLVSVVGSIVLIGLKQYKITPYVLSFLNFLSLLFYVYSIYFYVSVVLVGIDLDHFEPKFFVCTIGLVVLLASSITTIFTKQEKEEVTE